MKIDNHLLKYVLRNTYFINGTAYAGKSTMVRLLSEKHGGICCEENYHLRLREAVDAVHQPNISYLNNLSDWHDFVRRTPEEYEAWIIGSKREVAELELLLLVQYAQTGQKVFVDTNISPELLHEISDERHVLLMLSTPDTAVKRFFEREDREKQFLYQLLMEEKDPQAAMANFRACLERVNSGEHRRAFLESGFAILERDDKRSIAQTLALVERHFGLC